LDIYKCPKTVFPKKSWENKIDLYNKLTNLLKDFESFSQLFDFKIHF